jgi:ATP/ADP translocase/HEAT repeat protein
VRLLFLHHFFQGFGIALFFTVANALFLAQFAVTELPLVFMVSAVALLVVGRLYAWLEHHVPMHRLLPGIVIALGVSVLLARLGLAVAGVAAMAFALVVAHRVIYLLTNLEFWGVSALLLDVRQGKRLFGLISAGDVPAKLLGYLVVAALGPVVGLPNLLILAAASFLAALPVLTRLLHSPALAPAETHDHAPADAHHSADGHGATASQPPLLRIFGSPLIAALAGLSFVAVIVFTCVDFAFLDGAQARYGHGDATELAHFLGLFLGFGKALTIVTKLFFSGRIVERIGVKRALLLPPALLLLVALGTAAWHALGASNASLFALFGLLLLVAETFRYTLHDPIFLALFQPLNRHLRLHGHTTVKGIVDPLALGAAGALLSLLIWLNGSRINPVSVNHAIMVLLVMWLGMVLVVGRHYLHTLSSAIRRRFLEGGQVAIGDRATTAVLREKLDSSHPEEVIYAIELLSKALPPAELTATLTGLLRHSNDAVRRRALEKMDASTLLAARADVLALAAASAAPAVRAAAVAALAQVPDDDATTLTLPFLDDEDPTVRRAAITGLLRSGGLEAVVMAGQQLLHLVEANEPPSRALAAQIIGELRVRSFYQPLQLFLRDPDATVRRHAIEAAGLLANERLLPTILTFLADPTLYDETARALTGFGETALPALQARMHDPTQPVTLRLACIEIVGRIGGAQAIALLTDQLTPTADRRAREASLRALRTAGYQAPRGATHDAILALLDEQVAHSTWCLRAAEALASDVSPPMATIRQALDDEGTTARERLFRLLALLYEPRTVLKVRAGLDSLNREQAANALEILDHLLPKRQAAPLALLLERLPAAEKLQLMAPHVPMPPAELTPVAVLRRLLTAGPATFHRWTIATALHALLTQPPATFDTLRDLLHPFLTHPDALLRQTATVAQRRVLSRAAHPALTTISTDSFDLSADELPMSAHSATSPAGALLEIEKVVVLKSTSIFADTPEHILVDVAAIVHEQRVTAGKAIFHQGDFGDAMYVIYQGEVRIHAGDTTFATLRNRDIFGELALLDPEPRSASATATTDSLLLRLDQEAFYELMAERREVAQGVLRMLTRRLRAQNQLLAAQDRA